MEEDAPLSIPVEDAIDLHTFRPSETAALVADYLQAAHARGLRQVRIIHGRGIGVQREIVRCALARSPFVLSFGDADPSGGGWGAQVAVLREEPLP